MSSRHLNARWTPYPATVKTVYSSLGHETDGSNEDCHHSVIKDKSDSTCRSEYSAVNYLDFIYSRKSGSSFSTFLPRSNSLQFKPCYLFQSQHQRHQNPHLFQSCIASSGLNVLGAAASTGGQEFPAPAVDFLLVYVTLFLFTAQTFVFLVTASLSGLAGMGNEGSVPSSEDSTPISEYPSLYSIQSRVRSSVESTRAPSPMEAPEPDLSHLTSEEIAQIRSVMERARNLQQEESSRAR